MRGIEDIVRRHIAETEGFQLRGFPNALRTIVQDADDPELMERFAPGNIRVTPDAFRVEPEDQRVVLVEIEDTSVLTREKLLKLSEIWFALDCIEWTLVVDIRDRYGRSTGTLSPLLLLQCLGVDE